MRFTTQTCVELKEHGFGDDFALATGKTLIKMALEVWEKGCIIEIFVEVRDDPMKWDDPIVATSSVTGESIEVDPTTARQCVMVPRRTMHAFDISVSGQLGAVPLCTCPSDGDDDPNCPALKSFYTTP